ncbi:hypothetical protein CR513_37979, partial [Mucuna pruriens]
MTPYKQLEGVARKKLKMINHRDKILLLPQDLQVRKYVMGSKLTYPIEICSITNTRCVFVEQWHKDINFFHFLVREMIITLDYMSSLLHLPISGTLCHHEELSCDEVIDYV